MANIPDQKAQLRQDLRKARQEHVAALPPEVSALVFRRPPSPILDLIPENAPIGLYHAAKNEAPAGGYARFFIEAGHTIALPRISNAESAMAFHSHTDPFGATDLEEGPKGLLQPPSGAETVSPKVLFVPVVGFTELGHRIGQGGGFYDRYLNANPGVLAIGLAWDVQQVDHIPIEDHDMPLDAIITPTRIYGPF